MNTVEWQHIKDTLFIDLGRGTYLIPGNAISEFYTPLIEWYLTRGIR